MEKLILKIFAYWANDFNRTDSNTLISNISGPLGIPDYINEPEIPEIHGKAIVDFS